MVLKSCISFYLPHLLHPVYYLFYHFIYWPSKLSSPISTNSFGNVESKNLSTDNKLLVKYILIIPYESFCISYADDRFEQLRLKFYARSVVSDSEIPWTIQYTEFSRPESWTGVGNLSLVQEIFPTQGSNPGLPHCGQTLYQLSHKGSPRMLECSLARVQQIFQTQESNWGLLHCRWILYQLSYQGLKQKQKSINKMRFIVNEMIS